MKKNGGYKLGATYKSSYWGKKFTVLEIHEGGNFAWSFAVTVQWEDGRKTTHSTPLDKKDKEIA